MVRHSICVPETWRPFQREPRPYGTLAYRSRSSGYSADRVSGIETRSSSAISLRFPAVQYGQGYLGFAVGEAIESPSELHVDRPPDRQARTTVRNSAWTDYVVP